MSGDSVMYTLVNSTFSQPFDIIIGTLLCLSFLNLSTFISNKIKIHNDSKINLSIIYLILTFSIGQFIFLLSLIYINLNIYRAIILIFILITLIFTNNNYLKFFYKKIIKRNNNKLKFIILGVIASLFLLSLIPASDVDSLDYHLGLSINIINEEIYRPNINWIHSRVVGLGEFLNLFGVIAGTKNFGSIYQFSIILILIKIFHYYTFKKKSEINFYYLILSCPLIFTFIIFQKIQFAPSVAIFLSIMLIVENINLKNFKINCIIVSLIFFAIIFKYSFLINLFSIFFVIFIFNFKNKYFYKTLLISIPFFLVIAFPFYLKNYIFFNDALTPFFEKYIKNPDPIIINFAETLKSDTYDDFMVFNLKTIILFPIFLGFSFQPHFYNHLLGIGIFLLYFFIFFKKTYLKSETRFFIIYILVSMFFFIFVARQLTPRYYIDIYLVNCLLIIYFYNYLKNFFIFKNFFKLIKFQSIFLIIFCLSVMIYFLPGSLNSKLYDKMMLNIADGYAEAKWVDQILPIDAIYISENSRSHSLFPRKFVSIRQQFGQDSFDILKLIKLNNVNYAVVSYPFKNKDIVKIINNCDYSVISQNSFKRGIRNPLSKFKSIYNLKIIKIRC